MKVMHLIETLLLHENKDSEVLKIDDVNYIWISRTPDHFFDFIFKYLDIILRNK